MVAESIRRVVNAGIVAIGGERQIPQFDSGEDAEQAIDRLAGIVGQDLPPDFGQVALMSEDQLRNAQGLVQTFDRVVWVLIGLAILLSVLAVLLAPSVTGRPAAGRRGRRGGRAAWLVRGARDHRCRGTGRANAGRTEGSGRYRGRGRALTPAAGYRADSGGPAWWRLPRSSSTAVLWRWPHDRAHRALGHVVGAGQLVPPPLHRAGAIAWRVLVVVALLAIVIWLAFVLGTVTASILVP